MKVALLGSFPIFPYRDRVRFWNDRPSLNTTWNLNLAYGLAQIPEMEVHVVTLAPLLRTKVIRDGRLHIHFIGHLPMHSLLNRFTDMQYTCFLLRRYLKWMEPDVVHGSGTDHEYAYVATTSGFPNIITVHGVMKEVVRKMPPPWLSVVWKYAKYESLALKRARHLISINPYVEAQFPDYRGKIYRIDNPIAPIFFSSDRTEPNLDIVFVGQITERKRILNLIRAVGRIVLSVPGIRVAVIGGRTQPAYYDKLQKFVAQMDLDRNIVFMVSLPQAEIAQHVARARMMVLPSVEETAPMVLAEAMALGTPVIATDVGGIRFMVRNGESGFVVRADDVEILSEKIALLLEDEVLRQNMAIKARTDAKRYHPDAVARKTADAYKAVIRDWKSQTGVS